MQNGRQARVSWGVAVNGPEILKAKEDLVDSSKDVREIPNWFTFQSFVILLPVFNSYRAELNEFSSNEEKMSRVETTLASSWVRNVFLIHPLLPWGVTNYPLLRCPNEFKIILWEVNKDHDYAICFGLIAVNTWLKEIPFLMNNKWTAFYVNRYARWRRRSMQNIFYQVFLWKNFFTSICSLAIRGDWGVWYPKIKSDPGSWDKLIHRSTAAHISSLLVVSPPPPSVMRR